MKQIDFHLLLGVALVLLGGLTLLERLGIFRAAINLIWGVVFLVGAIYFLYRFVGDPRLEWWAAIPGFALAGLAGESLLPRVIGDWNGFIFLGALGLGFFAVYLSGHQRWWAIIPGGVLITLAFIALLEQRIGSEQTAGFLFLGLGLTFLLVGILASRQWAYIPAVVLLALGALLGTAFAGAVNYVWPAALILAGLVLVLRFSWKR
jgi:hypothetical protein